MLIEIIGGSGSGKSKFAEDCCEKLCPGQKLYIATMEPYDKESYQRIARHKKMRSGKHFDTLECYTGLEQAEVSAHTVLLECMSNLVANEMYSPSGRREHTADWILRGVKHMTEQVEHLVIVTNQVFSGGMGYDPETMEYLRVMAQVNQRIAEIADGVYEVVHGIVIPVKEPKKDGAGQNI